MNDKKKLLEDLREDYIECYSWKDKPNAFYAKHKHSFETKIMVLEGSMGIMIGEEVRALNEGNILIIEAGQIHEVNIGGEGCTYLACEGRRKRK